MTHTEGSHGKYREIIHMAVNAMSPEQKKEANEFIEEMFDIARKAAPHMVDKAELKAYKLVNGPHLNHEYAQALIDKMVNADGTKGMHFTFDEAEASYNKYVGKDKAEKYNVYDWWWALNMHYSDYYPAIRDNVQMYIQLTMCYFDGPDEEEGKAFYQVKHELKELFKEM